jgi:hypothetical protein
MGLLSNIGLLEIILLLILVIMSVGYMMPWIIAVRREKKNQKIICLFNLLLGWTFVGWIIALIWAFSNDNNHS